MRNLCLLAIVGGAAVAMAQDATVPESISANSGVLGWDAPTVNEDGSPCVDLSHHILALWPAGASMTAEAPARALRVDCLSECESRINDLSAGLEEGIYQFAVLAVDVAGNESSWSEALVLRVDKIKPAPPRNLRRLR